MTIKFFGAVLVFALPLTVSAYNLEIDTGFGTNGVLKINDPERNQQASTVNVVATNAGSASFVYEIASNVNLTPLLDFELYANDTVAKFHDSQGNLINETVIPISSNPKIVEYVRTAFTLSDGSVIIYGRLSDYSDSQPIDFNTDGSYDSYSSVDRAFIAKFTAEGNLDTTYGTNGVSIFNLGPSGEDNFFFVSNHFENDYTGDIYLTAYVNGTMTLVKVGENGLDIDYTNVSYSHVDSPDGYLNFARGIWSDKTDAIYVGGRYYGSEEGGFIQKPAIVKFNLDLELDTSFADQGVALINDLVGERMYAINGLFPSPTAENELKVTTYSGQFSFNLDTVSANLTTETEYWQPDFESARYIEFAGYDAIPSSNFHIEECNGAWFAPVFSDGYLPETGMTTPISSNLLVLNDHGLPLSFFDQTPFSDGGIDLGILEMFGAYEVSCVSEFEIYVGFNEYQGVPGSYLTRIIDTDTISIVEPTVAATDSETKSEESNTTEQVSIEVTNAEEILDDPKAASFGFILALFSLFGVLCRRKV